LHDFAIWNTWAAVRALVGLGASFDKRGIIDNLLAYYGENGGFSLQPEGTSGLLYTFYGVNGMALLGGLGKIDANLTTNYVMSFYNSADYSFNHWLMDTYFGCAILNSLGTLARIDSTGVGAFVLSCQSQWHGGFQSRPGVGFVEAISNCRWAILCLSTLNLLSLLDGSFTVLADPVWTGGTSTTTTPTTTPTTTVPQPLALGMLFVFAVCFVAALVFILVVMAPRSPRKKRIKRR
jgi:hypothetical protein